MLAKQYWEINHNPNSLLARNFKEKYFPKAPFRIAHHNLINLGFGEESSSLITPNLLEGDGGLAKETLSHLLTRIGSRLNHIT